MGTSWRIGVNRDGAGTLVTTGLCRFPRNPTCLDQLVLLTGVAIAVPAMISMIAPLLFLWSANVQLRSDEASRAPRPELNLSTIR